MMVFPATLGEVILDVVISDNPSHESEITERPVESGANVSDHMKMKSPVLTVSGVVVGDDAWERLQKIRGYQQNGELATYTNRVVYANMGIESINTEHSGDIANGFKFDITLRRLRIAVQAEIKIVNVPPPVQTKAKETTSAGTKQTVSTQKKDTQKEADEKLSEKIRNFNNS